LQFFALTQHFLPNIPAPENHVLDSCYMPINKSRARPAHGPSRESNPFPQQLTDLVSDLIFVADLDEFDLVYINQRVEPLLGCPADAVYEQPFFSTWVHPQDYERLKAHFEACKALQEEEVLEIDLRLKVASGEWGWFRFRDKAFTRNEAGIVYQVVGIAQCIQEQVGLWESRMANEALMRQAEEIGKFGSYEADIESMRFVFSDGLYRLFGYAPGGFEPSLEFVDAVSHPQDVAPVRQVLEQARLDKQPYVYRRRIYQPDGQMRYLCSRGKVVCDAAGNARKFLGIVEDITDQVHTDLILNTINEVFFELDKEYTFTYANRRAYEVWNKTAGQVIGKNFLEAFPEDRDTALWDTLVEATESGRQVQREVFCPVMQKWIFLTANPYPNGLIVFYLDVSEQVNARLKIQEYQHQLRTLVENIPDLITRWDKDLRLMYGNPAFETLMEKPLDSLQGKTAPEMILEDAEAQAWSDQLKKVVQTGKPLDYVNTNPSLQGAIRHFISQLVPERAADGSVQSVLAISRDITDQVATQKALLEAERLSVKGKMARTIAHEVRGPLVNIKLALELLEKEYSQQEAGEEEPENLYTHIISRSCHRIEVVINELLNLANEHARPMQRLDLARIVEETLALAEDRLFLKAINVNKQLEAGCHISGEGERLKIAILNLLHNAIEAMEAGKGVLSLKLQCLTDGVILHIEDNGSGIAPEEFNRIFEPYYTSKSGGMGVGLSNARAIFIEHRSQIKVKSEPGKGTLFTIIFPPA
jgi:PAS domain S-box-containing protein